MKGRSVLKKTAKKKKRKRDFPAVFSVIPRMGSGLIKVLFLFVFIAVISLSFLCCYNYLLASPYMKLEYVEVEGVDGEVRHDLVQMGGLNSNLSLLELRLDELKQRMEKHVWVRSVKLERKFPHTLIVRAEKESPSALVVLDKIYYMNRYGEIFKEVHGSEEMDFPIITGVSGQGAGSRDQLTKAANVMRVLEKEKGSWALDELSEIHVEKEGEISLYFKHLAAEIKLMSEDLSAEIAGLKKVTEHLRRGGRINQVTQIDLTHMDGALVSFKKG